jgi:hypothetical protein
MRHRGRRSDRDDAGLPVGARRRRGALALAQQLRRLAARLRRPSRYLPSRSIAFAGIVRACCASVMPRVQCHRSAVSRSNSPYKIPRRQPIFLAQPLRKSTMTITCGACRSAASGRAGDPANSDRRSEPHYWSGAGEHLEAAGHCEAPDLVAALRRPPARLIAIRVRPGTSERPRSIWPSDGRRRKGEHNFHTASSTTK